MKLTVSSSRQAAIDHELLWTSVGVLSACVAWVVCRQPLPSPIGLCVFKAVTGWPCVTCGGTRAIRALCEGDLPHALRANPLVALGAIGWAGYGAYALGALTGGWPRLRIQLDHASARRLRWVAVFLVGLTWAYLVAEGR